MKLKFMLCSNLNLKENRDSQCPIPCFSQKAFTVHYSLVRLSGTYLMREKQTPIKLFHKALAQWTPKPNLSLQAPMPFGEHRSGVMPMLFLSFVSLNSKTNDSFFFLNWAMIRQDKILIFQLLFQ